MVSWLGFDRLLHFPYTCNDTQNYMALVRSLEIRLPLLPPSVAALIGCSRPQPTNIAAHFLQPPAHALEAQTK
jgi:hypothetical protein